MPLKRLLIILYICLIGLLAAATFIEQAYGTEFVERNISVSYTHLTLPTIA